MKELLFSTFYIKSVHSVTTILAHFSKRRSMGPLGLPVCRLKTLKSSEVEGHPKEVRLGSGVTGGLTGKSEDHGGKRW